MIHEDLNTSVPDRSADVSTEPELQNANEVRRKRIMSEKQLLALQRGREKRWRRTDTGQDSREEEINGRSDLPPLKFPSAAEARDYADINDQGYYTASSTDSDEDEEDRRRKTLYRLRDSIPKSMRKRVDKYIKMKMEESKTKLQRHATITPFDTYLDLPPLPPPPSSKTMNSKPGEMSPEKDEEKENIPPYRYNPLPYNYL